MDTIMLKVLMTQFIIIVVTFITILFDSSINIFLMKKLGIQDIERYSFTVLIPQLILVGVTCIIWIWLTSQIAL